MARARRRPISACSDGYAAQAGKPYEQLTCDEKQGAYASHGLHSFVTHDSDNAFIGEAV